MWLCENHFCQLLRPIRASRILTHQYGVLWYTLTSFFHTVELNLRIPLAVWIGMMCTVHV